MTTGTAVLFQPTLPSAAVQVGPPDDTGIRWRSLVRQTLKERQQGDFAGLLAFTSSLNAAGIPPHMCARIEAGLAVPTPAYRAACARYLGVPESDLFTSVNDTPGQTDRAA